MAWSTVTLSTLNSISRYEAEINNLAGTYTRSTLLLTAGGYIIIDGLRLVASNITAIYIDGTTEELVKNGSQWDIITGGYCVSLQYYLYSIPTIAGSGDPYDNNGLYYVDISECSGVAWDNSIIQTSWANKIIIAKSLIGEEIKKQLGQLGWRDSDVTSGEVLDYVQNTDALNNTSDWLTLHLIYNDLFATQLTEAYASKRDYYWNRYQTALQNALFALEFGETSTNTTPMYSVFGSRLQV